MNEVANALHARLDEFMLLIKSQNLPRVLGTGVFLTRTARDATPIMI
jgi:hypothetical protein